VIPDCRSRVTADRVRPRHLPKDPAGRAIHSDKEAVRIVILTHDDFPLEEDGRTPGAVFVLEGAKALFPNLVSIQVVTKHPKAAKENVEPLPVTGWGWRRRIAGGVYLFDPLWNDRVAPKHFSGRLIQSDGG